MPLLIDGHNLIGRMPDLCLDDPDDEAELVRRVRRYCWRRRRRATIVFDAGLPGGPAPHLSGGPVQVIFAPAGSDADTILLRHIRRARDPRGLVVVSSDGAVRRAARERGARAVPSKDFAVELTGAPTADQPPPEKPEQAGDVEEWLRLFGRGR
ncbi:MAG TPA: hypothetical protein EYH30_11560 [Anaerolineales bacterium]|nr:hypothetical protein [Anaerolineae bacterium]HIQ02732.1 hypothetical protein [Anaerolineales bacterium]